MSPVGVPPKDSGPGSTRTRPTEATTAWLSALVSSLGFVTVYLLAVWTVPGQRLDARGFAVSDRLVPDAAEGWFPWSVRALLPVALAAVLVVQGVVATLRRAWRPLAAAASVVAASVSLSFWLKTHLLGVPDRGTLRIYEQSTYPSVHVVTVTALAVAVWWLWPRPRGAFPAGVGGLLVALTCVGNVSGLAHVPSDVMAPSSSSARSHRAASHWSGLAKGPETWREALPAAPAKPSSGALRPDALLHGSSRAPRHRPFLQRPWPRATPDCPRDPREPRQGPPDHPEARGFPPSCTISRTPPVSDATTAAPAAMPSRVVKGHGSGQREGTHHHIRLRHQLRDCGTAAERQVADTAGELGRRAAEVLFVRGERSTRIEPARSHKGELDVRTCQRQQGLNQHVSALVRDHSPDEEDRR